MQFIEMTLVQTLIELQSRKYYNPRSMLTLSNISAVQHFVVIRQNTKITVLNSREDYNFKLYNLNTISAEGKHWTESFWKHDVMMRNT